MKLDEFRDSISKIEFTLIDFNGMMGLCRRIYFYFQGVYAYDDFNNWFKPCNTTANEYWFPLTKEHLLTRLLILRLFEQVAIDEKLYKCY